MYPAVREVISHEDFSLFYEKFEKVQVTFVTIEWDGGDLDPEFIYARSKPAVSLRGRWIRFA